MSKNVRNFIKNVALSIILVLGTIGTNFGQGLGLNNPTPDASAILDLTATNRGLLVPRMTTSQKTSITSPATGLLVFDTDLGDFHFYDGTGWIPVGSTAANWTKSGNYVYNTNDSIGIGTATPGAKLDVKGSIWMASSNNVIGAGNDYGTSGNSASGYLQLYNGSTGNTTLWNTGNFDMIFGVNNAEVMRLSSGDVGIGTASPSEDFHVFRGDADVARIYATGSSQGSGMIYAGQSSAYGGGFVYDGDGTPALVGGTDRVTFFRRNASTDTDVMSFAYNNSTVRITSLAGTGSDLIYANSNGDLIRSSVEVSTVGDITDVTAGTGLTGGGTSGAVTLNVDVGTGPNQIVQLDGTSRLPAVDGSQLTNIVTDIVGTNGITTTVTGGSVSLGLSTNAADATSYIQNQSAATQVANFSINGTGTMAGFQLTTAPTAGYILASDAAGVGTWTDPTTISDGDWTVSGNYVYNLTDSIGIGTSNPIGLLHIQDNAMPSGTKFLIIGNDAFLTDIDLANTLGIYGNQDNTKAHIKLGSAGPTISGVGGNVGIGTTGPASSLHVKSTTASSASSEDVIFRVESNPTGGTADRLFEITQKNDGTASATYGMLRLGNEFTNSNTPNEVVISASGNSYVNGGNVGIGDATPDGKLEVRQTGTADIFNLYDNTVNVFSVLDGGDMWAGSTTTFYVDSSAGSVGIGTTTPTALLEISALGAGTDLLKFNIDRAWKFRSVGTGSASKLDLMCLSNDKRFRIMAGDGSTRISVFFSSNTPTSNRVWLVPDGGLVGIGTASPGQKLHISNAGSVFAKIDAQATARAAQIEFARGTGNSSWVGPTSGNQFHIWTNESIDMLFGTSGSERMRIESGGDIGIRTAAPQWSLDVNSASGTYAAEFNRIGTDGSIIRFTNDGTFAGSISVSGTTVSYNAFTGSHYGWSKKEHKLGELVTLTGDNYLMGDPDVTNEVIYGITTTTIANDPKVMGAYGGKIMEEEKDANLENAHTVMAVGNGDMLVVHNGQNLKVGDYLISSDLAGYAMLDKGDYDISYIVARVAEPVVWSKEDKIIEGRKVKRISVFFESFTINHKADRLEKEIDELNEKYDNVKADIDEIHQLLELKAKLEQNRE